MSTEITDEKAVITIEVELVSDVTGDPVTSPGTSQPPFFGDELPPDMEEIIREEVNDSIKDAIEDALQEEGIDLDSLKELTGLVQSIDSKGVGNIQSFARNPESFMENTFLNALASAGPYGALAAAIVSTIAGAPAMVEAVVQALGMKGGPLNQDFRFNTNEQYNQQFDRRVQFRRLTQDDPVITVTSKGFVRGDPDFIDNSLVDVDTARTARVNLRESSIGIINGI